MTNEPTAAEAMTRAEIRAQIAEYAQQERKLLAQFIVLEKAGGVEPSSVDAEEEQKAEAWARERLNGHGAQLLGPRPAGAWSGISQTRIALKGVRKILAALNKSHLEAAAVAATQRAEKLAPTEAALVRDALLTTARWLAATERLDRFYEEAGGDVKAALPLSHFPIRACEIETHCSLTVDEMLAKGVEAGTVSAADVRKARQA